MKARGIFITGTDTGVGKTYIGTALAAALRARSINVGVMKPAESGCEEQRGRLIPSDALLLKAAARSRDAISLINPYRFEHPLAPAVAAELEGTSISPKVILTAYRGLAKRHDLLIVEGAGGILVPLRYDYTYLDLVAALRLPVIIVARPSLGTINHTLLTITALRDCGVRIAGIVVNHADRRKHGRAGQTSAHVIEIMSKVPILATVNHGTRDFSSLADSILAAVRGGGSR